MSVVALILSGMLRVKEEQKGVKEGDEMGKIKVTNE